MQPFVELSDELLIATGDMRHCYRHPDDPGKCIKVDRVTTHKPATVIEAAYFQKIYRIRRGRKFSYLSNFHGLVDTELGTGAVYDLVCDEGTGDVSQTLMNFMMGNPDREGEVNRELGKLKRELLADPVIIRDFRPWNVCAQRLKNGEITLKVIDGFGHKFFFPICDYVPFIARGLALKYWERNSFDSVQSLLERFGNDRSNKWQGGEAV